MRMGHLVYTAITSLDGYVADASGNFDWAMPDEEVHRFVNQLERPIGTYLYGRRMYEVMRFWDTTEATADQPDYVAGADGKIDPRIGECRPETLGDPAEPDDAWPGRNGRRRGCGAVLCGNGKMGHSSSVFSQLRIGRARTVTPDPSTG